MGVFWDIVYYSAYMCVLFMAALSLKYRTRGERDTVSRFFEYVRKGRRRVPLLSEHMLALFLLQLLYPVVALFLFQFSIPAYLSFAAWFAASFLIFYRYSLKRDMTKRHRHNGMPIGFEYPHPIDLSDSGTPGREILRPVTAGSKGIYDLPIRSEPNPHAMVIGETGSGKSSLVTTLLARAYLKYGIPFLIIDWAGSYEGLGVNLWRVPQSLRINPLALRGMERGRRAGTAAELLQMGLSLTDLQAQKVRETLSGLYLSNASPTIEMLHAEIEEGIRLERYKETKLQLVYIANKLRQAFGIFGDEPKSFWDGYDGTCCVVSLKGLTDTEKRLVTHTIVQRIVEEFGREGPTRLHIALDDAYQALPDYFGKETNITRIVREGRKYGFGLVIATQMLQDMPEAIPANTAVKFILSYHEPRSKDSVCKMLSMSRMEMDVLHRMPVGSALLFDQASVQSGSPSPAYVEIDRLGEAELERLRSAIGRIEAKDYGTGGTPAGSHGSVTSRALLGTIGLEIPAVSLYRYMVAVRRAGSTKLAARMVKERKWITSDRTIYGGSGVVPMAERLRDEGYLDERDRLTGKALAAVDPDRLVDRQGQRNGSETHRALMRRTIETIQDGGDFAFVLGDRSAFDVGRVHSSRRKGIWDASTITGYEIQTNAIRSEVEQCVRKAKERRYGLVFVTNSKRVRERIEEMTEKRYRVLVLKPFKKAEQP